MFAKRLSFVYNIHVKANRATRKMEKVLRVLSIVLNALLIPLLIFVAIFSLSIIITKVTNGVPSVFGYTQIKIISGSMQDAGFPIGTETFVQAVSAKDLKEHNDETGEDGDYIAFFQYVDPDCSSIGMVNQNNRPDSKASNARILFHEIWNIYQDSNGELWFETKGTNNTSPDSVIIHQNYVIGKWVEGETFWTNLITFVTSPIGIVCLTVVPCSLIVAVDIYQLIVLSYAYHQLKKEDEMLPEPVTEKPQEKVERQEKKVKIPPPPPPKPPIQNDKKDK